MNSSQHHQAALPILYLSRSDIVQLGGATAELYIKGVKHALVQHEQKKTVQPLKPYLRWYGDNGHIADRIIAMPAYVGGPDPIAGIKWVGSKHDNPVQRGCDRASAIIILNDPETHYPIAFLEGGLISGMRTAAITAIGCEYLARSTFRSVTCIGCGSIAQMQLSVLLEQYPQITHLHLFDLNQQKAMALLDMFVSQFPHVSFEVAPSAEHAVRAGEVIITCTVTDTPYIPYHWLQPGTFISNISIMDIHKDVFVNADKVVVDDWDQSNREKKVIHQLVQEGRFSRSQLYAELGEIVAGHRVGRETETEIIVLNPMGMAVEDIACAHILYEKARTEHIGTWLDMS